jgi:hypothetical protein
MNIINSIKCEEFFYSILTVFVTVILLIVVKEFGNIPTSPLSVGTNLNVLTYGFLWDTSIKALRGQDFWTRFPLNSVFFTKPVILFLIFVVNFLIMAWNLKLEHMFNERIKDKKSQNGLKVTIIALGCFSLIIFLILNSAWV